jgi:hypothetical protein
MKNLEVILEKQDDEIWGRLEAPGIFYTTVGETVGEIEASLKELIEDFLENEGASMAEWKGVTIDDITFTYTSDLTAFFDLFNELKKSTIANRAGINETLLRQYSSGLKHPSTQQAKKIEEAIHELGEKLLRVSLV